MKPPAQASSSKQVEGKGPHEAVKVGAAAQPTDVSTTGSTAKNVLEPVQSEEEDSVRENPYVQIEGGFLAGLALGFVPFAGLGQQVLDAGGVLPHGSREARLGLAVGQMVGGFVGLVGGISGEVLGGAASTTGIGAAVGVPAMVVSAAVVTGSLGNIAAGVRGLMTTGGAGPVLQGQGGVAKAEAAAVARGKKVIGKEITVKTAKGNRRIDLLVEDDVTKAKEAIEVKTGGSRYTTSQQAKDAAINTTGGVAVGENARKAGVVGPIRVPTTLERY